MVQTNEVYTFDDQGRVYVNCKFHIPRGMGSCAWAWSHFKSFYENVLLLYKSSFLLGGKNTCTDQTNWEYSNMTKERSSSTKIVDFITPGPGVFVLGHGQISHSVKMQYFFSSSSLLLGRIRQIKYRVITTNEALQKCKFNGPRGRGFELWR